MVTETCGNSVSSCVLTVAGLVRYSKYDAEMDRKAIVFEM
jgi:hypothetical protein